MTSTQSEGDREDLRVKLFEPTLQSIDRELAFYRSRSGQIYLVALSAEALIIVGRDQIKIENVALWAVPLIVTLAFLAVAVVGAVLGTEYRRRIHHLKESRTALFESTFRPDPHPKMKERRVSEIGVLYFVLGFTSGGGSVLAWLRAYPDRRGPSLVAIVYAILLVLAAIWGILVTLGWSPKGWWPNKAHKADHG